MLKGIDLALLLKVIIILFQKAKWKQILNKRFKVFGTNLPYLDIHKFINLKFVTTKLQKEKFFNSFDKLAGQQT